MSKNENFNDNIMFEELQVVAVAESMSKKWLFWLYTVLGTD